MSVIHLPQKIYSGIDSFDKIFDKDFESVLIISDGGLSQKNGSLLKLKRKLNALFTRSEVIISEDTDELFSKAKKYAEAYLPEAIIAIGSGKTLDCGTAVSKLCEIPLISVVETLPTALSEFDTLDLFLYKNASEICIIDPIFITHSDSSKIAYEALGMACLALECAVTCKNRYISELSKKAFCEIYKNIMPAYRGEISARENLSYAMYCAYLSFINSYEYSWESVSFRISSFFSRWQGDRISTLAVGITNISQYFYDNHYEEFKALSKQLELTPIDEIAPSFLLEEIRRIQATLTIPFALRNFMIDENDVLDRCSELSEEDRDLVCRCFYGNITFIKS